MEAQTAALVGLALVSIYLAVIGRAFASYSRAKLDDLLEQYYSEEDRERRGATLLRTLDRDEPLMLSAYALRVVVNLAMAGLAVYVMWGEYPVAFWISVALFLFVGEVLPKALATAFADGLIWHAGRFFRWTMWPVLWIGHAILKLHRALQRLFNKAPESEEEALEDRLRSLVSEGESEGVLAERTQDIIESVLDLHDTRIMEIMTPRTDLCFVDINTSLDEAVELAHSSGHSRIPVFEGTRDNVVGIFYAKDLLRYWNDEKRHELSLASLMRKPTYVPETSRVVELLVQMRGGQHLAVVTDEYGGTAGVVTIEDILEEIVGEIRDEYDVGEVQPTFTRKDSDTIVSDARVHLDDLTDELGLEIPEDDDVVTLGGFITSRLGHIPTPGESFLYESFQFRVLEADERRVLKAELTRVSANGNKDKENNNGEG